MTVRAHTWTPCPCGERMINAGADLCNVCRAKGMPFCLLCGVRVGRRSKLCADCRAIQRVASRHSRQTRLYGAYYAPCPVCDKSMHVCDDFKICQWCGFNVLLVDGGWI